MVCECHCEVTACQLLQINVYKTTMDASLIPGHVSDLMSTRPTEWLRCMMLLITLLMNKKLTTNVRRVEQCHLIEVIGY